MIGIWAAAWLLALLNEMRKTMNTFEVVKRHDGLYQVVRYDDGSVKIQLTPAVHGALPEISQAVRDLAHYEVNEFGRLH